MIKTPPVGIKRVRVLIVDDSLFMRAAIVREVTGLQLKGVAEPVTGYVVVSVPEEPT